VAGGPDRARYIRLSHQERGRGCVAGAEAGMYTLVSDYVAAPAEITWIATAGDSGLSACHVDQNRLSPWRRGQAVPGLAPGR